MAMTRTKGQFIGLGIAAFIVFLAFIVNLASGGPNWYNNGKAYPAAFAKAAGSAAGEALVPGTGQLWCQTQLGDFAGGRDQDNFGVNLNSPLDPYSSAGTDWINGCAAGFLLQVPN